jgi:hypothetical protein
VLARDEDDAEDKLGEARAVARAAWELETTAKNLSLIRAMRAGRGEDTAWLKRIEARHNQANPGNVPRRWAGDRRLAGRDPGKT